MKHTLSKKWIFPAICCGLSLLAAVCLVLLLRVCTTLPTLGAADSWAGESGQPFAQIACYLPNEALLEEEDIFSFRQKLGAKLTEAAMEAPENGALYTDAYCGKATLTVAGARGSAEVKVTGVGGDFFRFHPLQLRSGSYLAETDLMKDRVLLDEELAWKLFGGMDLAGLNVRINGAEYYIAGVVAREKDNYSGLAYTDGAGMFMCWSALKACAEDAGISCYEAVLPNPIRSYAANTLQENFPLKDGILVENSSRYSVGNLLDVVSDFGKRSMGTNGIIYPYWENAVRLTEDYAALLLVLTVLFGALPAVTFCVVLVRQGKTFAKKSFRRLKDGVENSRERRRETQWQKYAGKKDEHGQGTV